MVARSFSIRYAPEVASQVIAIGRRWSGLIRRTIEEQLQHEPLVQTVNRKPLQEPSSLAEAWELRFGPGNRFRVFYRVDIRRKEARVLALGVKKGNRLFIGREEFDL
jgi:hypothetical protein